MATFNKNRSTVAAPEYEYTDKPKLNIKGRQSAAVVSSVTRSLLSPSTFPAFPSTT